MLGATSDVLGRAMLPRVDSGHRVMKRRTFLALVPGGLLAAPYAVEAQQAAKTPRIGYIGTITPATPEGLKTWEALLQGLREQGYAADRTLAIERRYLEGKNELASTFVAELLQMNG